MRPWRSSKSPFLHLSSENNNGITHQGLLWRLSELAYAVHSKSFLAPGKHSISISCGCYCGGGYHGPLSTPQLMEGVPLPLFLQIFVFDDSSQTHYVKHQASHFLLKTYSSSTSGNLNEWPHYPQFILSKLIMCLSLPGTILFAENTKSPSRAINNTQMLPQRVMRSVKKIQQDKEQ